MTDHSTYELLRQVADSWGLMAMLVLWAAFGLWAFRPGGKAHSDRAATMIFEDDQDGE